MTIGRKLHFGFGSIIAIIVILFIVDRVLVLRERASSESASMALESSQSLEAVQSKMTQVQLALDDYLLTGDVRQQTKLNVETGNVADLLEKAKVKAPTEFLREVLGRLEKAQHTWTDKFADPLVAQRQRVDAGRATVADLQILFAQQDQTLWNTASAAISEQAHVAIRKTLDDSMAAAANAMALGQMVQIVVTILAIALCLAIAYHTATSIIRPLRETVAVLRNIAEGEGDLTRRVNQSTDDELGELGRWFNLFMVKLESLILQVAKSTQGVAGSSENLFSVSHQMGVGAEETSAQANVVAAAAEQVTRNLQTVAAATEEMNASIGEISKNASAAAGVAALAVERALAANATMGRLGEATAEIGEVVKVINSVAQQTKLLALNATIEAARAGDAGKGFAVVANEVKELANETAKATRQISAQIQAIRTGTEGAVEVIAEVGRIIAQMHDISTTIASAVEEQTATTKEIARNVSEAAMGESHVTENITSVAQAARSTSGGAQSTQTAAGELAGMAAELQRIVGVFKYANGIIAVPATAR
jgi:methyl-accepting chemotaxis protein